MKHCCSLADFLHYLANLALNPAPSPCSALCDRLPTALLSWGLAGGEAARQAVSYDPDPLPIFSNQNTAHPPAGRGHTSAGLRRRRTRRLGQTHSCPQGSDLAFRAICHPGFGQEPDTQTPRRPPDPRPTFTAIVWRPVPVALVACATAASGRSGPALVVRLAREPQSRPSNQAGAGGSGDRSPY